MICLLLNFRNCHPLSGFHVGFSLLLFITTIWTLAYEQGCLTTSNWAMISIAAILLVLSTTHMVVDIVHLDEGMVKYCHTFPGGPVAFFGDLTQNTFVIKNTIYALQMLVGDGMLIYYYYVIWQSIWIIVLPAMLWWLIVATGVCALYSISQATSNAMNIFAKQISQWITTFYITILINNLLSSGLLAYCIWTMEHSVTSIHFSKKDIMMLVLHVLVNTAILYSAILFTMLLCFINANNGQYIVTDMIMLITSITFYMILIHITMRQKNMDHVSAPL
ncbi:hypothetical protein HD554DRAFT_2028233 [Boletus coccyginus]|nr:hypothetical protein HD554DRAFT_2028233 [Boletus coccyginus]